MSTDPGILKSKHKESLSFITAIIGSLKNVSMSQQMQRRVPRNSKFSETSGAFGLTTAELEFPSYVARNPKCLSWQMSA